MAMNIFFKELIGLNGRKQQTDGVLHRAWESLE